jgi:flagellar basal body rod protein FlgG
MLPRIQAIWHLDGNGFFLVEQNDQQSLTRAGNFQVANSGSLMTQEGASVLGYPVVNEASKETHNFSIDANLSSNAALEDTVSTPHFRFMMHLARAISLQRILRVSGSTPGITAYPCQLWRK